MDIGEEEVVSMPISTSFATANDSSKLRMLATSAACPEEPEDVRRRKEKQKDTERSVRYKECLKNHAASLGGHVTDGCGEFMPGGPEGTPESLRCAACDCHRNFHRREIEGEEEFACEVCYHRRAPSLVGAPPPLMPPGPIPSPALPFAARAPQVLAFRSGDEHVEAVGSFHSPESLRGGSVKKRFRTKFTSEQKERMLAFAQRVGWRIQKHDEAAVQQFCQEIGVKRHVLKVWMHNNKHAFTRPHQHHIASSSDHTATAMLDNSNNNNNNIHINDNTGTTATNSSSNNDSTHSERDFQ
eukprot:TRINITY_DN1683_c0_g1_i1.p1 TRINITY_DN1683_c0_g1~~TRINITY_DN1683_c0_g1_i1.p1  ORF type:complete len:299 (+),score=23.79 TRINITY_DN1683_c0_g1_i1:490-1386(+)